MLKAEIKSSVHLKIYVPMYSFTKKLTFFVICVKKTQKILLKAFLALNFVFYPSQKYSLFSVKQFYVHIECEDECAYIF
jgi:hypothetical protein